MYFFNIKKSNAQNHFICYIKYSKPTPQIKYFGVKYIELIKIQTRILTEKNTDNISTKRTANTVQDGKQHSTAQNIQ